MYTGISCSTNSTLSTACPPALINSEYLLDGLENHPFFLSVSRAAVINLLFLLTVIRKDNPVKIITSMLKIIFFG
jgi:hypothetical protein